MENTKETFLVVIYPDGKVGNGNLQPLFYKSQLLKLSEAIQKTLQEYEIFNFHDDLIYAENSKFIKKQMVNFKYERKTKEDPTTIYIMIDHNTGFYKIGHSQNVLRRESTLQSEKPTIELLYTFEGIKKDEKDLHENYKDLRVRGEWFALEPYMVENIIKHFEFKRKTKERREQRRAES